MATGPEMYKDFYTIRCIVTKNLIILPRSVGHGRGHLAGETRAPPRRAHGVRRGDAEGDRDRGAPDRVADPRGTREGAGLPREPRASPAPPRAEGVLSHQPHAEGGGA